MKTSSTGRDLIRHFEGDRLTSYKCPAGIWTIGVGHTGPDVKPGQTITQAASDALLAADLVRFEKAVSAAVKVPLTQHQFDALVALCFNIGAGAFTGSTLVRLLNGGDYKGAAAQFDRWNRGGGKVLKGLVNRRAAERKLFERA